MKKVLLSLSLLASLGLTAQVLESDDFSTLAIGNIGASNTTAGQGDFYSLNGVATDFQIVADNDITRGNVLQITGSNTDAGTRYLWRDGLADNWSFRDAGNNILEVEFDFFTGPVTTSKNSVSLLVFDGTLDKVLAGLSFQMDTKIIQGVANYDARTQGGELANYNFRLGATDFVLPANTWVRVGSSFNKTTGEVKWRGPGFNGYIMGAATGADAGEADFIVSPNYVATPANTVASAVRFDNYTIKAEATDRLLAVDNTTTVATSFDVFPNPVNNVVNVSNAQNNTVNKITVTDVNGRIVKEAKYSNETNVQMNVSELSSGVYMMNISSEKGSTVKKIIKN